MPDDFAHDLSETAGMDGRPLPIRLDPALAPVFEALRAHPASPKPAREGLPELVLLISATCNMACAYCYANEGEYVGLPARAMRPETAVAAVDRTLDRFGAVGAVQFFGGEPSLNARAISAACERFGEHLAQGRIAKMPKFAVITNLVAAPKAFLEAVARYDIQVTVSIDGPREIHDRLRPRQSGRGSYDAIIRNIAILRDRTGQPDAAECVYTPLHHEMGFAPSDISAFLRSLGISQVLMHPLVEDDGYLAAFTPEQSARYLGDLRCGQRANMAAEVRHLIANADASPAIVRGALDRLRADSGWHCGMGQTTFTIDVTGEAWPCYMCIGREDQKLGEVSGTAAPPDFDKFGRVAARLRKDSHPTCRSCDLRRACHGCLGKMMGAASDDHAFTPIRANCEWLAGTLEGLMDGVVEALEDDADWRRLQARLGISPAEESQPAVA